MRLRFIFSEVMNGLRRNSTMALSVVLVTFVSLTFVGAAALIQMQLGDLKTDWYGKVEVSVFLCPKNARSAQCASGAVTADQQEQIRTVLEDGPVSDLVKKVYFESKEEAFENYKRQDNQDIAGLLTADQMQPSFRVKLNDPEQFQVKLASSGQTLTVPADKSIVQVLAEAGVDVPVSCEQGVCGTCVTRVLEGEPDHRDFFLTADEQARNDQMTVCCSRAKTPLLVLDL